MAHLTEYRIKPVETEDEHRAALAEIDRLWGSEKGTPEGDALDVLLALVELYEDKHFPMPRVDPVAVLEAAMEQRNLTQRDLAEVLGSHSRASEILNRKRGLSVEHIRAIRRAWGIPADALI
jgi:HTH-type transcriptional regulator/antitoxin HigA